MDGRGAAVAAQVGVRTVRQQQSNSVQQPRARRQRQRRLPCAQTCAWLQLVRISLER